MKYKSGSVLLEAIISLVILSFTGIAMIQWLNQIVVSQGHLSEKLAHHNMLARTLVYMEKINPMEQPEGSENFGDFNLNWHSTPIGLPVQTVRGDRSYGAFSIQRFHTQVEMSNTTNEQVQSAEIILLGYRRTQPKSSLFLPGA